MQLFSCIPWIPGLTHEVQDPLFLNSHNAQSQGALSLKSRAWDNGRSLPQRARGERTSAECGLTSRRWRSWRCHLLEV